MDTKCEASHYATSSVPLLLLPPEAQIISLKPSLKQPQSMLLSEYKKETKFHTHTKPISELWFCIYQPLHS
jgi:hypothetical protein